MAYFYGTNAGLVGEICDTLTGDMIGGGESRHVYECRLDPSLVVKVEWSNRRVFSNAAEWDLWGRIKDIPELARWFAPCVSISAGGAVMLQKRTTPIFDMPTHVPSFFYDVKRSNIGMIGNQVVAHDYAFNAFADIGIDVIREEKIRLVQVRRKDLVR